MIEITPAAAVEINRLKYNRHIPDSFLRLSVKAGGCLDFFYDLSFEATIEAGKRPNDLGDEPPDPRLGDETALVQSDRILELNGINLVVDSQSWSHVEHLKLDYAEDLMGGGFRFYNPLVAQNCGCGISFSESQP